jgi:hypothetical protein
VLSNDPAKESLQQSAEEVATHKYEVSDYHNDSELSQGLAETHEQFSDAYFAGTSDGKVMLANGQVLQIPSGGYEEDEQPKQE